MLATLRFSATCNIAAGRYFVDNIFLYKIYQLGKSTALLVAVFPLFLSEKLSLSESEIILIGSYFFLLPLIFEVPLGILADIYGSKRVIYSGLVIFILAFVALLIMPSHLAYMIYLLAITFAGCCFSGSEDSLLMNIIPTDKRMFEIRSELTAFNYKASSILILLGGGAYYFNPIIPIILQILCLGVAAFALSQIKVSQLNLKIKKKVNIINLLRDSKSTLNVYRLSLIFLIALCGFIIIANNRVVSIAFADILPFGAAMSVSIIFVLGNIISSKSSELFYQWFKGYKTPLQPLAFLCGLVFVASIAMSFQSIICLVAGFWLLCAFKSAYRIYLNSVLLDSLFDRSNVATVLSLSNLFSGILAFLFSFLYGNLFSTFQIANWGISIFLLVAFSLVGLIVFLKKEESWIVNPANAQSNKVHKIKRYYQEFYYEQIYPQASFINIHIKDRSYSESLYPAPSLLEIKDNIVKWSFIRGRALSEVDRNTQLLILDKIVEVFKERLANKVTLSHGDLHPDNIQILDDNSYVVLDWDLCQNLSDDFDILSLFTSPRLLLSEQERIAFVQELFGIEKEKSMRLMVDFIRKKIMILQDFKGDFIKKLTAEYRQLESKFSTLEVYYN